jgi:hypothetical protein
MSMLGDRGGARRLRDLVEMFCDLVEHGLKGRTCARCMPLPNSDLASWAAVGIIRKNTGTGMHD